MAKFSTCPGLEKSSLKVPFVRPPTPYNLPQFQGLSKSELGFKDDKKLRTLTNKLLAVTNYFRPQTHETVKQSRARRPCRSARAVSADPVKVQQTLLDSPGSKIFLIFFFLQELSSSLAKFSSCLGLEKSSLEVPFARPLQFPFNFKVFQNLN